MYLRYHLDENNKRVYEQNQKRADAIKYLRKEIKAYIEDINGFGYASIKQFLEHNCITRFETNVGEFWLEKVVFE